MEAMEAHVRGNTKIWRKAKKGMLRIVPVALVVSAVLVQSVRQKAAGASPVPAATPAGWSDWESLNNTMFQANPTIISSEPGQLDVFGLPSNPSPVFQQNTYKDGLWSGWKAFSGTPGIGIPSELRASTWGPGHIDLFVLGAKSNIGGTLQSLAHQQYDNGRWLGWEVLSEPRWARSAGVASWAPGHIDVFTIDASAALWHDEFESSQGGWRGWEQLTGNNGANAGNAVSPRQGVIDLVIQGGDGNIYHRHFENGWSGWENLGGPGGSPAIAAWSGTRLDVFMVNNNSIHHKWKDRGAWSGWEDLGLSNGSRLDVAPQAVSWGPNRIDLIAQNQSGTVIHKSFQQ